MRVLALAALLLTGCAAPAGPGVDSSGDGVLPGRIGVVVTAAPAGVRVAAHARDAGLSLGDVVLRYNGNTISDTRQFYSLVVDTRPGTVARLHVLHDGGERVVEVPVVQLDTAPRT